MRRARGSVVLKGMNIVEERDTFLLIEADGRWAVVEQRAGRFYPMRDGARPDEGCATPLEAVDAWSDESAARAKLAEVAQRGRDLAERLW